MLLLKLLKVLAGRKEGLSFEKLLDACKTNPTSLKRHLKHLREAGFLQPTNRGQRANYRLSAAIAVGLLTDEQLAALLYAHQVVAPLRGSRLVRELDDLIDKLSREEDVKALVRLDGGPEIDGLLVDVIQQARIEKKRLGFQYWSAKGDSPEARRVDPLLLYISANNHAYLEGFDLDRREVRTFKLTRMSGLHLTGEAGDDHPGYDPAKAKAHAHKVWDAPVVEVRVQLDASKARFAKEWPLNKHHQSESPQPDGSVVVRAKVAGIEEALKWVLSWGAGATVIAPAELREAHQRELSGGLKNYALR